MSKTVEIKVTPDLQAVSVQVDGAFVPLDQNQEGKAGPFEVGSSHNAVLTAVGEPGTEVILSLTNAFPAAGGGIIPNSGEYQGVTPFEVV